MSIANQLGQPLRIDSDPFEARAGDPYLSRPLQTTFREVLRQIVLRTPLILVTGGASTGKTLLTKMIARTCANMGLSVRSLDQGPIVHGTPAEPDVLLIDDADAVSNSAFTALEGNKNSATTVLLGRPSCVGRFAGWNVQPLIIELTPLSPSDARLYLLNRATDAGWPDLFTPDALDLIVDGSSGSVSSLRSTACFAFLRAASDGATQIGLRYAAAALAAQAAFDQPTAKPAPSASVIKLPLREPQADKFHTAILGADATAAESKRSVEVTPDAKKAPESIDVSIWKDAPAANGPSSARRSRTIRYPSVWRGMQLKNLSPRSLMGRGALITAAFVMTAGVFIWIERIPSPIVGMREATAVGGAEANRVTPASLTAEQEPAVAKGIGQLAPQIRAQPMFVVVSDVNAHEDPLTASAVVARLPRGLKVTMVEQRDNWILVAVEGPSQLTTETKGWVFNRFLKEADDEIVSSENSDSR